MMFQLGYPKTVILSMCFHQIWAEFDDVSILTYVVYTCVHKFSLVTLPSNNA